MRLLRQISLDSNMLRHSASTSKGSCECPNEKLATNVVQDLLDVIDKTVTLIRALMDGCAAADGSGQTPPDTPKSNKNGSILKSLEKLNSLLVQLILCNFTNSSNGDKGKSSEKPKSKLRRHYSAFVSESGVLFRAKKSSTCHGNGTSKSDHSGHGVHSMCDVCGGSSEEAIQKLVESNVLWILLNAIPHIGFEEKKLVRIIVTNSLILETKKTRPVVDHFCDADVPLLRYLVESYGIGRSDVTMNCGCILRFASQFEPIVTSILQSDYFYNFFEYMKRSPSDFSFDVAMDVFFTFKTVMTRHKRATSNAIRKDYEHFFHSFKELLENADRTENYVTKRQSLEIFAEIFSGPECSELRSLFVAQDKYIIPVIEYLWSRNLQIRLRCLVLLSQLFIQTHSSDQAKESLKPQWKVDLLVQKLHLTLANTNVIQSRQSCKVIKEMFAELRTECDKSNIKHFTSQIPFVDSILHHLK